MGNFYTRNFNYKKEKGKNREKKEKKGGTKDEHILQRDEEKYK